MANFEDGVKRYIKARAVVEVGFPVDWRDSVEIACKHCPFYIVATRKCGLTHDVVYFPEKYVGSNCPLEPIEENEETGEIV